MTHQPIEFTSKVSVTLLGALGGDVDIVSAARVDDTVPEEWQDLSDGQLLEMLVSQHHGTPFEHAFMKFFVRAPIFVSREHFRHRIGHSYNEFSTRYKRLGSKANPFTVYIPHPADFRSQVGRPGSYEFLPMDSEHAVHSSEEMKLAYEEVYRSYCTLLDHGVAKEVARNVLPLATMTSYVWSANPRSLMHFLGLRNAPQALLEIRRVAEQVEGWFSIQFPETYKYYVRYGRITP